MFIAHKQRRNIFFRSSMLPKRLILTISPEVLNTFNGFYVKSSGQFPAKEELTLTYSKNLWLKEDSTITRHTMSITKILVSLTFCFC